MKRSLFITVAILVIFGWLGSTVVFAQDGKQSSELVEILSGIQGNEKLRLRVSTNTDAQICHLRGLAGDTLLVRSGRLGYQLCTETIDSLWVRDRSKGSGSTELVIGAVTGTVVIGGAIAALAIGLDGDDADMGVVVGGALMGFTLGSAIGGMASDGSDHWILKYPTEKAPNEAPNTARSMKRFQFGVTPDLKTGVRLAASYSF